MPAVSILIPFWGNDEHRKKLLNFVDDRLRRKWYGKIGTEILIAGEEYLGRAGSRNLLASEAKNDALVFLDADSYVPIEQILQAVYRAVVSGWALPYMQYMSLDESATKRVLNHYTMFAEVQSHDCDHVFPTPEWPDEPVGGCVVVMRKAFEEVGGYDERFRGWGEEDRAFVMALETLVSPMSRIRGRLFHLWHERPGDFDDPHFPANRQLCNRYRAAQGDREAMKALVTVN